MQMWTGDTTRRAAAVDLIAAELERGTRPHSRATARRILDALDDDVLLAVVAERGELGNRTVIQLVDDLRAAVEARIEEYASPSDPFGYGVTVASMRVGALEAELRRREREGREGREG